MLPVILFGGNYMIPLALLRKSMSNKPMTSSNVDDAFIKNDNAALFKEVLYHHFDDSEAITNSGMELDAIFEDPAYWDADSDRQNFHHEKKRHCRVRCYSILDSTIYREEVVCAVLRWEDVTKGYMGFIQSITRESSHIVTLNNVGAHGHKSTRFHVSRVGPTLPST
jgi:hypothetical protein